MKIHHALLCVGLLFSLGCSTFERDWKRAQLVAVPAAGIEGRWEGTWLSDYNSHTDELRCLITRGTNGLHHARFHAKYQKVFSFEYTVGLKVESSGSAHKFTGDADLGWLAGGLYHYVGEATLTNFLSTYRCKYDHGTFRMMRPSK